MGLPDLTVLVVTHNGCAQALATLQSAHESVGDLSVEWIVVDSGSRDGTAAEIERQWPEAIVLRRENRGFAAGNNVGLRIASGRYVLLLNPDVQFVHGTMEELVQSLDERPDVGAASVVQKWPDGNLQWSSRRFPSPARQWGEAVLPDRLRGRAQEAETDPSAYAREHTADWLVGAFLIVRREIIEEVGLLDERFFLYAEETDWCYRIRRAGWEVRHLPTLEVIHHVGGYPRADLAAQLVWSKRLYARKHLSRSARGSIHAAIVVQQLLRIAARVPIATIDRGARRRLMRDGHALAVALGIRSAPFEGMTAGSSAGG